MSKRVFIETYGCQMNVYDSARMADVLAPMGYRVISAAQGADMVILESNYDRDLLMNGPYPWHLKQRISSTHGHLANSDSAETLARLAEQGLRHAVLAHLSQENNRPDIARATCERGLNGKRRHFQIDVAAPDRPTPVFMV